jgi:hypothetical protein
MLAKRRGFAHCAAHPGWLIRGHRATRGRSLRRTTILTENVGGGAVVTFDRVIDADAAA